VCTCGIIGSCAVEMSRESDNEFMKVLNRPLKISVVEVMIAKCSHIILPCNFARAAAAHLHARPAVRSAAVSSLFLTIPARPIISKSDEPIFAKFSGLVELWLYR